MTFRKAIPYAARPIADELTAWRKRMGLTQAAAAARLRVSLRTLEGWTGGRPCRMPDTVLRLMWMEEGADPDFEPCFLPTKPRRSTSARANLRRNQRVALDVFG